MSKNYVDTKPSIGFSSFQIFGSSTGTMIQNGLRKHGFFDTWSKCRQRITVFLVTHKAFNQRLAGFAGVPRQRPSISNVRVWYFGSTGWEGFTHLALV